MGPTIEEEVFAQHALEAGFLWSMRDGAALDPAYDLPSLCYLDERVEANLDGLRLAEEAGWKHCKALLDGGEAGEVFAAGVLAVDRGDLPGLACVLDVGGGDPKLSRGLVSALGWSSFDRLRAILPGLLHVRCPPALHFLGIAACAAHRRDPGPALGHAILSDDARLRARALRAVGELGRLDLLPELRADFGAVDEAVRFSAAWSAALLGEAESVQVLWDLASKGGPFSEEACDMAMRRMAPANAYTWLYSLANAQGTLRPALAGAAALGDPAIVPWLLECAETPETARAAGGVLAMITGLDLTDAKATTKAPKGFQSGPTDDPGDDSVAMDPDESLPWPDAAVLRSLWNREASRFQRGTRYLLGKPIAPAHLRQVLKKGSQPARAAAAIELSLHEPRRPVFEVRAPGFRQRRELG